MNRHMFLVLDLSTSMAETDIKPSRLQQSLQRIESFIKEYFDQNPISQLSIVITRDGLAITVTELSG